MVRSLSQWTKTLSFPARISPNRNSKECNVNVHPITLPPPTPPRKSQTNHQQQSSQESPSPQPNVPITEISQIVSSWESLARIFHILYCCTITHDSIFVNLTCWTSSREYLHKSAKKLCKILSHNQVSRSRGFWPTIDRLVGVREKITFRVRAREKSTNMQVYRWWNILSTCLRFINNC